MVSQLDKILNYRVFGEGHPVVFLHGFLESISMWDYVEINNCKAILIDLPGHGLSGIAPDESIASMAAKVIEQLKLLGIRNYDVIGHSMGGYVAIEVLNQTNDVRSICLMHSNFWQDSETKKRDRERVAEIVKEKKDVFLYEAIPNLFVNPGNVDKAVKTLIHEAQHMTPEAIASCSIAMRDRLNHQAIVADNEERVTIIQGLRDNVVPVELMNEKLTGISLNYIQIESGHMSHIENTKAINEVLDKWTKKNGN